MTYPILEHDYNTEAKIEPARIIQPRDMPEHAVICFFREVIEKVVAQKNAKIIAEHEWEDGPHPIYEMSQAGKRVAFYLSPVGAASAAGILEEVIAFGCRKFIVCGGAGVLKKDLAVGKLIVVSEALRDEGVSYHYIPPSRTVSADPQGVRALETALAQRGVPYLKAKTWTTDAPYRETPAMIESRRNEGCVTVEMEAAAFLAVAQVRNVPLGQVLYAGDDLSGETWDNRGWQSRAEVREHLFWLAVEACLGL